MRQEHYTTFPPAVKLPELGEVLTAVGPDQRVSIWLDAYREPLVQDVKASAVSWQMIGRYAECLVRNIAVSDGVILLSIVFGGVR